MRKFIITLSIVLLASFGATQRTELQSMPINIGTKFTCSKAYQGEVPIVKAIGDVNGDTISDIAVGFSQQDPNTLEGIVAIIYGGANLPNGLDVCTFNDLSVGFRIKGLAGDKFGASIVNMGDLNSDGLQDIAVAAPSHGGGFGRVYVVYMPPVLGRRSEYSISALNTYSLTSIVASTPITTPIGTGLGTFMADPVDYNGDTLKDVLIGNAGNDAHAYIFFGQSAGSGDIQTNMLGPLAGVTLSPPTTDATFGQRPLASCLDFNQDTTADYVIPSASTLYILYGNGSRAINEGVTVSNANGEVISLGGVLTMTATKSVTCVDLDMDGRQEVAISLSDNNIHVLYGSTIKGLSLTSVDAKTFNQGFTITEKVGSPTFGNVLKRTDGWNGYGQDALLISDLSSSIVYSLYASSGSFNASSGMTSYVIDNMFIPQSGFKVYTQDGTAKVGSSVDATFDINGDGIKDLLLSEGISYNSYAFYGQCQSATGCACPNNLKYKNGQCVNWGLSGGQKVGIIVGVIIGAMLLIALGVLILKKTSCGANCFESYAKPAQFGSHTHAPIPQTMATSA